MNEQQLGYVSFFLAILSIGIVVLFPAFFELPLTENASTAPCDSPIRIRGFIHHIVSFDDWKLVGLSDQNQLSILLSNRQIHGTLRTGQWIEITGNLSCEQPKRQLLVQEIRQWTSSP